MADGSVAVVVTSTPYNLGTFYRSYHDSRPQAAYLGWLHEVGTQLRRVLSDAKSFKRSLVWWFDTGQVPAMSCPLK